MPRLREERHREQVAAVCYRLDCGSLEFLLVQTRGGRWIFPKGGVEPGLTRSQSAALEAFEEGGVRGRFEEVHFARYVGHDRASYDRSGHDRAGKRNSSGREFTVNTYLCEVVWVGSPQEARRNPTWFSPEKAKKRLQRDRARDCGAELARIVDRAAMRIERLRKGVFSSNDPLRRVQFEFPESGLVSNGWQGISLGRHIRHERSLMQYSTAIEIAPTAQVLGLLPLSAGIGSRQAMNVPGIAPGLAQTQFLPSGKKIKASSK